MRRAERVCKMQTNEKNSGVWKPIQAKRAAGKHLFILKTNNI